MALTTIYISGGLIANDTGLAAPAGSTNYIAGGLIPDDLPVVPPAPTPAAGGRVNLIRQRQSKIANGIGIGVSYLFALLLRSNQ